jgi:hypothetical protein
MLKMFRFKKCSNLKKVFRFEKMLKFEKSPVETCSNYKIFRLENLSNLKNVQVLKKQILKTSYCEKTGKMKIRKIP